MPPRRPVLQNDVQRDETRRNADDEEDLEDAIADDEYVDVDGVVRPKGLGVHNSLINWTNKAVPLGQRV